MVARIQADVSGRIVLLLQGMIEQFAREVFRDFAACIRDTVEAGDGRPVAPRPEALRALPLLLRALRSWIPGLVRPHRFS